MLLSFQDFPHWCLLFFFVQQAREMVLEIIREKDQADFRGVRSDFTSRTGGGGIEVSWTQVSGQARLSSEPACFTEQGPSHLGLHVGMTLFQKQKRGTKVTGHTTQGYEEESSMESQLHYWAGHASAFQVCLKGLLDVQVGAKIQDFSVIICCSCIKFRILSY